MLFTVFLLAAVYAIVAGSVAMSNDRSCAYGWESRWQVFPPGWECHRVYGS